MLLFSSFKNLARLWPTTAITKEQGRLLAITIRELRKLPRQSSDFEEVLPAEAASTTSIAAPPTTVVENTLEPQNKSQQQQQNHAAKFKERNEDDDDMQLAANALHQDVLLPTFNLAAYVDKSPTLQQFIRMGVDLSSIERRKGLGDFVLKLDFEQHVQPHLLFLTDHGVSANSLGALITRNPLLFKVELDDLQTRINYLEAKKFTRTQIERIITRNPYWLMFSTRRIDSRLGHFQQEFQLNGDDVRFLAAKQPRLITYNMEHLRKSTFSIREEMGFNADEIKCLLLSKPRLWMIQSDELVERFAYAHEQMQLTHNMLVQCPEVLTSREFRLRQRHEFLKMLGRAQYDPAKDLYILPKTVVEGTDYYFAKNIAKSDMKTYEMFLKTR